MIYPVALLITAFHALPASTAKQTIDAVCGLEGLEPCKGARAGCLAACSCIQTTFQRSSLHHALLEACTSLQPVQPFENYMHASPVLANCDNYKWQPLGCPMPCLASHVCSHACFHTASRAFSARIACFLDCLRKQERLTCCCGKFAGPSQLQVLTDVLRSELGMCEMLQASSFLESACWQC